MSINPGDVQLLFADLQLGIVARSKTNPPEVLACSAGVLAEVGLLPRLPMHLSVVPEGGHPPELIAELGQHVGGAELLQWTSPTF